MTVALLTVRDRLAAAVERLAGAGVETPGVDAEWLLAAALGVSRGLLLATVDHAVDEERAERYHAWIRRRAAREPLQHILGTQAFRDLTLCVGPAVLVPRPETELLVSWALDLLPEPGTRPVVIDVGTGSGCIACALASERPDARVFALDASPAAAALARENVVALGLADRVAVAEGDLFSGLAPIRVDLIVSNPPYIPSGVIETLAPEVAEHEPRVALDGGADGLGVIRRLAGEAPRWLAPGGSLVLETFGDAQVAGVVHLMQEAGFMGIATRRDLAGVTRFVSGCSPVTGRVGERSEPGWGESRATAPPLPLPVRRGGVLGGASCR